MEMLIKVSPFVLQTCFKHFNLWKDNIHFVYLFIYSYLQNSKMIWKLSGQIILTKSDNSLLFPLHFIQLFLFHIYIYNQHVFQL